MLGAGVPAAVFVGTAAPAVAALAYVLGVLVCIGAAAAGIRRNVRAVLAMSHAVGHRVVAEGVETRTQRDWLRANGCDFGQGWFYGRPLPAADQDAVLATLAGPQRGTAAAPAGSSRLRTTPAARASGNITTP